MTEENKIPEETTAPENQPEETTAQPQAQPADAGGKAKKKPKGDAAKQAALEQKLEDAQSRLDDKDDQFKRLAAEYANYKTRTTAEKETAFGNGTSYAAEKLLPVLDTLEAAANAETADEEYKKGVVMTLQKAKEVFGQLGIQEIDALGQPFDPELHNACMNEPCEGIGAGCVSKVMQKGYTLNDRVVRHAVVAVAPED